MSRFWEGAQSGNLLLGCALLAAISIPLILRMVGPNKWYGYRTRRTLSDRDTWFAVNAFGGWALLTASVASGAILLLGPKSLLSRDWVSTLVFVVPVIIAVAASELYLRRVVERTA
jgi:hypothetical protein